MTLLWRWARKDWILDWMETGWQSQSILPARSHCSARVLAPGHRISWSPLADCTHTLAPGQLIFNTEIFYKGQNNFDEKYSGIGNNCRNFPIVKYYQPMLRMSDVILVESWDLDCVRLSTSTTRLPCWLSRIDLRKHQFLTSAHPACARLRDQEEEQRTNSQQYWHGSPLDVSLHANITDTFTPHVQAHNANEIILVSELTLEK